MTRLLTTLVVIVAGIGSASALAAGSGGVTGPAFYVDGTLYRTVGTPTDLSGTGAPAHSFDTIYEFGGAQPNVATAAPGDKGYNGGRWRVQVLAFPSGYAAAVASADANTSGDLDSDEELATAFTAGTAVVSGSGPSFVCPVIPLPQS
ncbi:MAG TPA: hypothetical protein VFN99_09725 [Gaiella sp.]|nr:hypothetical protein [Gaiella sp.]